MQHTSAHLQGADVTAFLCHPRHPAATHVHAGDATEMSCWHVAYSVVLIVIARASPVGAAAAAGSWLAGPSCTAAECCSADEHLLQLTPASGSGRHALTVSRARPLELLPDMPPTLGMLAPVG